MWAFFIVVFCVGLPVGGGIALTAWILLLKARRPGLDPMQVLATRFATGEIDEAEYARRLHVLTHGPALELEAWPDHDAV
jgi:uncharacterized membrane protein